MSSHQCLLHARLARADDGAGLRRLTVEFDGTRGGWGIPLRARTEGLAVPILGGTLATQPIKPTSSVAGGRQTGPDDRRDPLGAIPGSHIPPVWLLPTALTRHIVPRCAEHLSMAVPVFGRDLGHLTNQTLVTILLGFPPPGTLSGHPLRGDVTSGGSRPSSVTPGQGVSRIDSRAGLVSPHRIAYGNLCCLLPLAA